MAVRRVAKIRHRIIMARATINLAKIRGCTVILRIIQYRASAIAIQMAVRIWLVKLHNKQEAKKKEESLVARLKDETIVSKDLARVQVDGELDPVQSVTDVAPSQDEANHIIKSHLRHMNSLATDECILDHMSDDIEIPKEVPSKNKYFFDHINAVRDTIGEVVAPFTPSNIMRPPQTPGSCISDMADSFQTAFGGCIGRWATPTERKSSRFSYQEYEEGEEQEKSCLIDVDNSIEVIEQFSPSSVVSGMTRSAHDAFNDCDAGSIAMAGAAMSNEVMEIVETRLKALSFASQEKAEPVGFLADTNMAYPASNVCKDGDLAEYLFADTDTKVQPPILTPAPSNLSNLGDKALAEFIQSVVVIQTYMHESSERRGVNANFTPMDSFEFENFYSGMLYGVNNTTEAMQKIVTCQSAARRLLAKRRVEEIRDACYLVLRYTGTAGTMCTLD